MASDRLRAEVARSGHVAVGGLDLELADGTVRALSLVDGSVTEDADAAVRRRLDATVLDDGGLLPLDAASPLFTGAVLRPWRGVQYPDGTEERAALGVLLAGDPVADLDRGVITLSAEDRSAAIAAAPLAEPWTIAAGTMLSVAVSDLLADRLPGCPPVRLDCDDVTLAETFIPAQVDPWSALVSDSTASPGLVHSAGRRLWFDADGVPVLMPLSAQAAPVAMDGALLVLTARAGIDTSRTFGGVVVTSNVFGDDDPMVAVRYDPDPPSELFARRLHFEAMDDIDNPDDLDAAADSLVTEWTGIRGTASWTQPPDPTLSAGDVRAIAGGPLEGVFEVRAVTTPLVSGSQSVETVERVA